MIQWMYLVRLLGSLVEISNEHSFFPNFLSKMAIRIRVSSSLRAFSDLSKDFMEKMKFRASFRLPKDFAGAVDFSSNTFLVSAV